MSIEDGYSVVASSVAVEAVLAEVVEEESESSYSCFSKDGCLSLLFSVGEDASSVCSSFSSLPREDPLTASPSVCKEI